jgi:hypothetical protein
MNYIKIFSLFTYLLVFVSILLILFASITGCDKEQIGEVEASRPRYYYVSADKAAVGDANHPAAIWAIDHGMSNARITCHQRGISDDYPFCDLTRENLFIPLTCYPSGCHIRAGGEKD